MNDILSQHKLRLNRLSAAALMCVSSCTPCMILLHACKDVHAVLHNVLQTQRHECINHYSLCLGFC